MVNVLSYVGDDTAAEAIVGRFTRALAVGSYLVMCHATAEVTADQMRAARQGKAGSPSSASSATEVTRAPVHDHKYWSSGPLGPGAPRGGPCG